MVAFSAQGAFENFGGNAPQGKTSFTCATLFMKIYEIKTFSQYHHKP